MRTVLLKFKRKTNRTYNLQVLAAAGKGEGWKRGK